MARLEPLTPEQRYAALAPLLADIESLRLVVRRRAISSLSIIGPIVALIIVVGFRFLRGDAPIVVAIVSFVVGALVWALVNSGGQKAYTERFKNEVLGQLVALYDAGLRYNPHYGITREEFRESRLFGSFDRYSSEDLFTGMLGATDFRFSEVHAEEKRTTTDSKGRTRTYYVTIFRGIFFIADFHKNFQGETYLLPDTAEGLFGNFGRALQRFGSNFDSRGELVTLESPEFEKAFKVLSTDQVEARYILSTSMMERIVRVRGQLSNQLAIAFRDSRIIIAIPSSKNRFEPPSIWSADASIAVDELESYLNDIRLAEEIVEELNLNLRIWSKQ